MGVKNMKINKTVRNAALSGLVATLAAALSLTTLSGCLNKPIEVSVRFEQQRRLKGNAPHEYKIRVLGDISSSGLDKVYEDHWIEISTGPTIPALFDFEYGDFLTVRLRRGYKICDKRAHEIDGYPREKLIYSLGSEVSGDLVDYDLLRSFVKK